MKNIINIVVIAVAAITSLVSCAGNRKPPVDLSKSNVIEVPFTEEGGVKTIPVKLNGVGMNMIFDTGCSGMSISSFELGLMMKNSAISQYDLLGTQAAQIADGSVVMNQLVNIAEVEIGGADGVLCYDVEASVVDNLAAPVLLGNGVLDEVASIEVDNDAKVIRFKLN